MIITIYESGYELPKSRGALYKEICKVMIERRRFSEGQQHVFNLTVDQTLSVLQNLAFKLVLSEQLSFSFEDEEIQRLIRKNLNKFPRDEKISVEAFITHIVDDVGLLTFSGNKVGSYEFNHRCIQEYLAASMIKDHQYENLLIKRILHEWWSETIRLYAAQSNATRIIKEADKLSRAGAHSVVAFKLVYDCLAEAMEVEPQLRNRLENALDSHLSSDDPILRSKAAEVKLIQRFEKLILVGRNLEIDQTNIMSCEYQLFIDEQIQLRKEFYQPDHWSQPTFPTNIAMKPIIGIRPQDATAFCSWLTQKYGKGSFEFRLPTTNEESTFLKENLTTQLPSGAWCRYQNTYQVEGLQMQKSWQEKLDQQLSQQVY